MAKQLKNCKLSCVGLDKDGCPARMIFFVYGVEGVENAKRISCKDRFNRKIMRQHNLDHNTVGLHTVPCNAKGEVTDRYIPQELDIMMAENQEIEDMCRIRNARSWLIGEKNA